MSKNNRKYNYKQLAPSQTKTNLVGKRIEPTVLSPDAGLDIDTQNVFIDTIIDAGLSSKLDSTTLEEFTYVSQSRDQLYQAIDTMRRDASVSSVVRTYAEEVCEPGDNGHIMWCESSDPKISMFGNYLLNLANVDKNMFGWAYNLILYGDIYLHLLRESDYEDSLFAKNSIDNVYSARNTLNEEYNNAINDLSKDQLNEQVNINVHRPNDKYSYALEMVNDPSTMFELVKLGKTYGYVETPNIDYAVGAKLGTQAYGIDNTIGQYKMKSNDVNIFQADDFVHAYLDDGVTRFPERVSIYTDEDNFDTSVSAHRYTVRRGRSLLIDNYKTWREKTLLENSVLLNRVTRSSIIRKIQVEIGDMPKEQAARTLRQTKALFENKAAINTDGGMAEYPDPSPVENFIVTATRNGKGAITVDSVGGDVNVREMADLDWWNNKYYSAYGIPKQYFGWTDDGAGFNGGTALTILSSVFAKGVKRVQNALIQAMTDALNLFFLDRGLRTYVNNFTLKMRTPVTQEELDYRSNLGDRISAISNMNSLFTDIEDKARRLRILKALVATLNYGDEIMVQIDKEILAAEEAAKKAAEEAEAQAQAQAAEAGGAPAADIAEPSADEDTDLNGGMDLADIPEAPKEESFENVQLGEPITEGAEWLTEDSEDLPSPADLDTDKDFTVND